MVKNVPRQLLRIYTYSMITMENLRIAIIDSNTLSCIGLRQILQDIFPNVGVSAYDCYDDFSADMPDRFIHYFVSFQIYVEHASFFLPNILKTIVLTTDYNTLQLTNVRMLNVHQKEKDLIKQILVLQQHGHDMHPDDARIPRRRVSATGILTKREGEVLSLIVKGLLNKEIAERLHIEFSTVVTHRKNINRKLGTKSVSKLAIYAVMNGYVEADKI
jgi:DNA-binding CsgD family transcriptional regulator